MTYIYEKFIYIIHAGLNDVENENIRIIRFFERVDLMGLHEMICFPDLVKKAHLPLVKNSELPIFRRVVIHRLKSSLNEKYFA